METRKSPRTKPNGPSRPPAPPSLQPSCSAAKLTTHHPDFAEPKIPDCTVCSFLSAVHTQRHFRLPPGTLTLSATREIPAELGRASVVGNELGCGLPPRRQSAGWQDSIPPADRPHRAPLRGKRSLISRSDREMATRRTPSVRDDTWEV